MIARIFISEFLHQKYALWLAPMFLMLSGMLFGFVLAGSHGNFIAESDRSLFPTIFILLTLFSILFGSEKIFIPLQQQHILQTFFLHTQSLRHIIITRILVHWLFYVLPAACLSPIMIGLFLHDATDIFLLAIPILIGFFYPWSAQRSCCRPHACYSIGSLFLLSHFSSSCNPLSYLYPHRYPNHPPHAKFLTLARGFSSYTAFMSCRTSLDLNASFFLHPPFYAKLVLNFFLTLLRAS